MCGGQVSVGAPEWMPFMFEVVSSVVQDEMVGRLVV